MGKKIFKRSAAILLASHFIIPQVFAAQCEYKIVDSWGGGFKGEISITNDGDVNLDGWNVAWAYTNGETLRNTWSATVAGGNPYSAEALSWNKVIRPGRAVTFGFVGISPNGPATVVNVTGDVCSNSGQSSSGSSVFSSASSIPSSPSSSQQSSMSQSSVQSSTQSSVVSSVSSSEVSSVQVSSASESSSSVAAPAVLWSLDNEASSLHFSTTKKIHIVENMSFSRLSGAVTAEGVASLTIDLTSIQSGIDIRNTRMQNLLFQTDTFSDAKVTLPIDLDDLSQLAVGNIQEFTITAELDLHGVTQNITTSLKISRLTDSKIMVKNTAPILIVADDYSLDSGVEALRSVANLSSIGKVVPVDFTLFYNAL